MTGQQQAQPEAELALGYCVKCHGYGRGEYVGPINSHSDAIRNHLRCPGPSPRREGGSRRARQ